MMINTRIERVVRKDRGQIGECAYLGLGGESFLVKRTEVESR